MTDNSPLYPIATFHSPFPTKFGIPKQSGLVGSLRGEIVFEPKFRNADALRGMDGFDYLWLIWGFSANRHQPVSPVVRPPVLGGNVKMGVFATRSPFRPNGLGLSSVRIDSIELDTPRGPIIHVLGADLMDGTPIYDIKPYVTYADCHPEARSGFTGKNFLPNYEVSFSDAFRHNHSEEFIRTLSAILALGPQPHYQHDPDRIYGMPYEGEDIHFRVEGNRVIVI